MINKILLSFIISSITLCSISAMEEDQVFIGDRYIPNRMLLEDLQRPIYLYDTLNKTWFGRFKDKTCGETTWPECQAGCQKFGFEKLDLNYAFNALSIFNDKTFILQDKNKEISLRNEALQDRVTYSLGISFVNKIRKSIYDTTDIKDLSEEQQEEIFNLRFKRVGEQLGRCLYARYKDLLKQAQQKTAQKNKASKIQS